MSCFLVYTRPGLDAKKNNRSNSFAVSWTGAPVVTTDLLSGLMVQSSNRRTPPVAWDGPDWERRSTDFIRATNSLGLKGFTT